MKIGNVIASTIALCWGLAVLIHHFAAAPAASASGSYGAGRSVGLLFALALGVAGGRGLFKEIQRSRAS